MTYAKLTKTRKELKMDYSPIKKYDPEKVVWFKKFYDKWIRLFAGEHM